MLTLEGNAGNRNHAPPLSMASQSCLLQDPTYGKKNPKYVGCRNYDKDQQHRGHCQQDDEGSKLLHVDMANRFVGHDSPPKLDELEAFPDGKPAGS